MSPGHHELPRFPNLGQKDKKPVKIPAPTCPRKEKIMLDCIKEKGNQYECRFQIRDHNDCLFRMSFQHW